MRRKKEDMLITKEQILNAAFDCFYEKGYEATSLEEIASRANVTRGAIYWHFSDKNDLYRAVIQMTMEKGDVAQFAHDLPEDMSTRERLEEVFWMAMNENRYVDFVFKTMSYTVGRTEFDDVFQELRDVKRNLLQYFNEEIRVHLRVNQIEGKKAEDYSLGLYLLFEGMFLTKNIPIGIQLTRENVVHYVDVILKDIDDSVKA
jgi:AcrR family transcriptional regulator